MQMSVQSLATVGKSGFAIASAALFTFVFARDVRCDPYASPWATGPKSALRLIAGEAGRDFYSAGVEIRLDPGALTYWRNPGAAGAPPIFSFEDSENIAGVSVLYPAPMRIEEAGEAAFGYQNKVIFPLHVTLRDEARPAILALAARYAVCEKICLPTKAEAKLVLPPAAPGGAPAGADPSRPVAAQAIAAAEAKVPARLTAAERDAKIAIRRSPKASAPTWRLTLKGNSGQDGSALASGKAHGGDDALDKDLFAEGPEGWYFETQKSDRPNEFLIVEVERPHAAGDAAPLVTLTLTDAKQSYEFTTRLDGQSAQP